MGLPGDKNWKEAANPAASFQLVHDDVHIWSASLEQPAEYREKLFLLLSFDERTRVERFYFEKDRNRYIIGRGLLRILLGGYLGLNPSTIQFTYGAYGKPALAEEVHGRALEFNVSHSNDMAVYIFTWDQPVGIDIEYIHSMKDMDDFALRFFTPDECALIRSLPMAQKQKTFFKLWTCKEAYLKAYGSGLTVPLNQVEVSFATEETASFTSIGGDREQAARWYLDIFNPVPGYQAALAVERQNGQIMFQELITENLTEIE
jgi:4'-phosphopantetheinyl transferase